MRYEEWEDPTLIYNDFDNDKIVFKGVETAEVEQVQETNLSCENF